LDISIWIPLISNEVTNSQRRSVTWQILHGFLQGFSLECSGFTPQMVLVVGTICFHKFSI
jgi:hypothetical protein